MAAIEACWNATVMYWLEAPEFGHVLAAKRLRD